MGPMTTLVLAGLVTCLVTAAAGPPESTRVEHPARYATHDEGVRQRVDYILGELDLREGDVVVDIGAGEGWWAERMAPQVGESGVIHAGEVEQDLVDKMTRRLSGFPQIRPYLCPTDQTGLAENTCDLALFVRVYHHLDGGTHVDYLKHLRSVIKPDGRLVVIDHHPDVPPEAGWHVLEPSELFAQAYEAGWVPVRYEQLVGATHYLAIFVQKDLFAGGITGTGWRPLFNGRDLDGWDIHLGHPMEGQVEHDRNPRPVFTVVELAGEPVIRVSGRVWGTITTREPYENYHLRLEFKWGERLWPPLSFRDSGIMYHAHGPPGAVGSDGRVVAGSRGGFWMESVEYQITERGTMDSDWHDTEVGGPYSMSIDRIAIDVTGRQRRLQKPRGEWNVVEIKCVGDRAQHFLNGELVADVSSIRTEAGPLTSGRIQIQSESAEIFFRRIEIRPQGDAELNLKSGPP